MYPADYDVWTNLGWMQENVEAWDAAYKLAILASLAFGAPVMPEQIWREGTTRVSQRDILYADEMGYRIKLLAIARLMQGQVEVRVHPSLVPRTSMLASVNGSFNAVQVEGDLIGTALFYGRGAGSEPTASAIIADVIALGTSAGRGSRQPGGNTPSLRAMSLLQTRYFGVSVLSADQEDLARHFSSRNRPEGLAQFENIEWTPGRYSGAPLLEGSLAWLECEVAQVYHGGDHSIFLGTVLEEAWAKLNA